MGGHMSFRSYALLVLALVVSACASSSGTSGGEAGQLPSAAATRGNANLIVRTELEEYRGQNALVAVEGLRRRWLQPRRSASFTSGSFSPLVVVNGTPRGELGELRLISSDNVETMRYLSPSDATTRYGTNYAGGAVEVTLITRR